VPLDSPFLEENLAALDEVAPLLAQRLRWQVNHTHLLVGGDGRVSYQEGVRSSTAVPISISVAGLPGADVVGRDSPLFLFGLGAGEILEHYLAAFPERPIVAWERDPSLLRVTLARLPVGPALRSGRLRLLLGADLLGEVPLSKNYTVVRHPVLGRLNYQERFLLDHPIGDRRVLVCEGLLFVLELTLELQQRGFGVYPIDFNHLSVPEILITLDRVKPEFVACINLSMGLAELCAQKEYKLLCWEIDPVIHGYRNGHKGQPVRGSTARSFVFTHRKEASRELRDLGFQHVEPLPLAADPESRKPLQLSPEQLARYGAPVSFVGTGMVDWAATCERLFVEAYVKHDGAGDEAQGRALLGAVMAEQRKDFSRYRLPELLRPHCQGWPDSELKWLVRLVGDIASSERRLAYVARLGRFGIQVWGDPGWTQAQYPGLRSVTYRGIAGTWSDLTPIYCASRINLDIGRLHQLDIVTMRVFDVLACGGFVLAERSEDLGELFEIDKEIACYSTLDELEQKTAHYLAHPEEARALAEAGRQAVLSRHTISKRVGYMLERMGDGGSR
jgi:hypothetical protein